VVLDQQAIPPTVLQELLQYLVLLALLEVALVLQIILAEVAVEEMPYLVDQVVVKLETALLELVVLAHQIKVLQEVMPTQQQQMTVLVVAVEVLQQ
tara:strand:+ start:219 stop:506 length:288 start_codon:yes stop_codon:yes gene_type:complete